MFNPKTVFFFFLNNNGSILARDRTKAVIWEINTVQIGSVI